MRTSRVPDPPPPGTIHLPTHLSASQIFHSLDESTRCQASHSPDSSSRWRNRYVDRPSGVQIHPASGEIWTYIHPRTVRFHPAGGGNGTFTCRVVSVWPRKRVGGEHGACHHDWEEHKAPVRIRLGGSHELCVSGRTVPSLRNHQHADFAFRRLFKNDIEHQRQCDSRSRALQNSRGHQRIGKFNVQAAITQPVIQSTIAVRKSTQLEFAFER